MDLQEYVDAVRDQLELAAQTGGDDAVALAGRLSAALESTVRLAILQALADAAAHITRELAPGSVDVRLAGRDPEFVVTTVTPEPPPRPEIDDDGGTWRISLRLPDGLRPAVEGAAKRDGISVNAWLVRAAAAHANPAHTTSNTHHIKGWVR